MWASGREKSSVSVRDHAKVAGSETSSDGEKVPQWARQKEKRWDPQKGEKRVGVRLVSSWSSSRSASAMALQW
jgi:hypothetical protein